MEALWGDGFVMPGGAKEVLWLAKPLGLKAATNLLLVGAGTGGAARALVGASGCKITTLEAEPALADLAAARLARAGKLKTQVTALKWVAPAPAIKPQSFDRCLALAPLRGDDPTKLIETLQYSLKPAGQMVLMELVADAPLKPQDPVVAAWCRLDQRKPTLPSELEMAALFKALGLDVRVTDDVSKRQTAQVLAGWQSAAAAMESSHPARAQAEALAQEAELWQLRLQLLQDGRIRAICWHLVNSE